MVGDMAAPAFTGRWKVYFLFLELLHEKNIDLV